jgi:hypothetical protein
MSIRPWFAGMNGGYPLAKAANREMMAMKMGYWSGEMA